MDANNLKIKPIPEFDFTNFKNYKNTKIGNDNVECYDILVDLKDYGIDNPNAYNSVYTPPYFHSIPGSIKNNYLRKTVAEKLKKINVILDKFDLELFIYDAYRPIEVQEYFYNCWVPKYLKSVYPDLNEDAIKKKVGEYWAVPPKNEEHLDGKNLPPHATGGAVDLTIRNKKTKQFLEMGSIFDDLSSLSHLYYFEKLEGDNKSFTSIEAKRNRRLLFNLMFSEGFAPHPREWWHFSYGDQLWANFYEKEVAYYGFIKKNE